MEKKNKFIISFIVCFFMIVSTVLSSNIVRALEAEGKIDELQSVYEFAKKRNVISNNLTATLTNENGEVVKIPVYELQPKTILSVSDNTYTSTCIVGLDKKLFDDNRNIVPFGSIEVNDDDGTYVYAKLVITYDKLKATSTAPARYLLTRVSGSWTVNTGQISLANRRVAFTCQSLISKAKFRYPTSNSFNYSTGYTDYVYDAVGSIVGAQMNVTVKRGTGSWQFDVYNNVIDQVPGLNDMFG